MRLLCLFALAAAPALAREQRVTSPDGRLVLVVSDQGALTYRVEDGWPAGRGSVSARARVRRRCRARPWARITATKASRYDDAWQTRALGAARSLSLRLQPGGGYAAVLSPPAPRSPKISQ